MPNTDFKRKKRILARKLQRKQLPRYVYRWDARGPREIADIGFQPWAVHGNIRMTEHVLGSFGNGPRQGQIAKYDSQWVSTGAYGMLEKLDPTMAQRANEYYLYRIQTNLAVVTGQFEDANDVFDRLALNRPYPSQREWVKDGGIPRDAVVDWMPGAEFMAQYDLDRRTAPKENELRGWRAMQGQDEP